MTKQKISIIYGGPSSEHDISIKTSKSIIQNIDNTKYIPYPIYIPKQSTRKEILHQIQKLKNMYMNILSLHGEFGEDGTIQKILESLNIPYTGSNSTSSALCMNKYKSGLIVQKNIDVQIPKTKQYKLKDIPIVYTEDICIKPNSRGSSVGVYIIKNQKGLDKALSNLKKDFNHNTHFLIQSLIDNNIEVSCGCLQKNNGQFIKLPPVEIIPKTSSFFDYKSKYTKGCSQENVPPKYIPENISQHISELAVQIHKILGCSVYSRSDFLVKENKIYYLETNTLPGMTSNSLLPKETNAIGITFTNLITFLIENS